MRKDSQPSNPNPSPLRPLFLLPLLLPLNSSFHNPLLTQLSVEPTPAKIERIAHLRGLIFSYSERRVRALLPTQYMNTTFSASTGGKTPSGATKSDENQQSKGAPFDAICTLEKEEAERRELEIAAMQTEEQEVRSSVDRKTKEGDQELRNKAKEELKEFRETELSTLIRAGAAEAAKEAEEIEASCKSTLPTVIETLVEQALDPSLLTQEQ